MRAPDLSPLPQLWRRRLPRQPQRLTGLSRILPRPHLQVHLLCQPAGPSHLLPQPHLQRHPWQVVGPPRLLPRPRLQRLRLQHRRLVEPPRAVAQPRLQRFRQQHQHRRLVDPPRLLRQTPLRRLGLQHQRRWFPSPLPRPHLRRHRRRRHRQLHPLRRLAGLRHRPVRPRLRGHRPRRRLQRLAGPRGRRSRWRARPQRPVDTPAGSFACGFVVYDPMASVARMEPGAGPEQAAFPQQGSTAAAFGSFPTSAERAVRAMCSVI
mmetsp:Transcript_29724/g.67389  ORF Transcript_29724/g.67389 Transcript_29724/m.67389 type:complete len:264 (-) Transcript_29724:30-821(-)